MYINIFSILRFLSIFICVSVLNSFEDETYSFMIFKTDILVEQLV